MSAFETDYIVSEDHIDDLNHVNNVVYLEWIQDIANLHWTQLKKGYDTSEYVWVVIRHEIDYLQQGLLGDHITARTWVGETGGIKSIRHVEFYKDSTLLVKAQTTFCLLNASTFKPTRITDKILSTLQVK